eukprot:COSAG02_NODE_1757_length_11046_cov_9.787613_1_plen_86_part_00
MVSLTRLRQPDGSAQPIVSVVSSRVVRVGSREFELDGVLGGRETLEAVYGAAGRSVVVLAIAPTAPLRCELSCCSAFRKLVEPVI